MKKSLEIVYANVTLSDIRNGECDSPTRCALALALRNDNPDLPHFELGAKNIWVSWDGMAYSKLGTCHDLTPEAIAFIAEFDTSKGKTGPVGRIPVFQH